MVLGDDPKFQTQSFALSIIAKIVENVVMLHLGQIVYIFLQLKRASILKSEHLHRDIIVTRIGGLE